MADYAKKSLWSKLLLPLSLLITTSISTLLLVLSARHSYITGPFLDWVQVNRATIQFVIHVIAAILGALELYVLSSILTFRTNIRLISAPISLDSLKLRSALNVGRLDFDLSHTPLALLALYWIAIQAPSAVWNGAITPVVTTANVTGEFHIAQYSQSSATMYWNNTCAPLDVCSNYTLGVTSDLGIFSYVAWKTKGGLLVNSAYQASNRDATTNPQYKKLDNTDYTFNGRSYGVGAAVGLSDLWIQRDSTLSLAATNFTYFEPGYVSKVNCRFNESGDIVLADVASLEVANDSPNVFIVNGSLPNGSIDPFAIWSAQDNETTMAIVSQISDTDYMYGIVGGGTSGRYYGDLNNIQCSVVFTPTLFRVAVEGSNHNITVTPDLTSNQPVYDIVPPLRVVNNSFSGVAYMSQTLTTLYTSILGDAFHANIDNVRVRSKDSTPNITNDDNNYVLGSSSEILTGVTEALEILLDNFLDGISAAQIILANDTQLVNATAQINVVKLGEPIYTYVTISINFLLLGLFVVEVLLTKFWQKLPLFDALDLKSAVLGAGIAASQGKVVTQRLLMRSNAWKGDAADKEVGTLEVELQENGTRLAFVDDSDSGREKGTVLSGGTGNYTALSTSDGYGI